MFTIIITIVLCVSAAFCAVAFILINYAHREQFKRADYDMQSLSNSINYADFESRYPRETLRIPSGRHTLIGFLYGAEHTNGLIVISSGHRCSTNIQLQTMQYFVDHGWMVICYDYTGYYNSEGKSMLDYTQAVRDLDAVLSFAEKTERFHAIPHLLYGHSLGAYVSSAVLRFNHKVAALAAASGFDKPTEQWAYSVKRFSGVLGGLLGPMAALYLRVVFGKDTTRFSAVAGINTVQIPVLVVSGTTDVFYGGVSPIYRKRDAITNPNCTFVLMDQAKHNGHYDYMLTDRAVEYQVLCQNNPAEVPDKWFISEQDDAFFDQVNAFFLSAVQSRI